MSLTPQARQLHALYQRCAEADPASPAGQIAGVIDNAARAAMDAIRFEGYGADNSDDAEALVAAVTAYFFASNPSFRAAVPGEAA